MDAELRIFNPNRAEPYPAMLPEHSGQFFRLAGTVTLVWLNFLVGKAAVDYVEGNHDLIKWSPIATFLGFLSLVTIAEVSTRCLYGEREEESTVDKIRTIVDRSMKWVMFAGLSLVASSEIVGPRVHTGQAFTWMAGVSLFPLIFLNEKRSLQNLKMIMLIIFNAAAYGVNVNALMGSCDKSVKRIALKMLDLCQSDFVQHKLQFIRKECSPIFDNGYIGESGFCYEYGENPVELCLTKQGKDYLSNHFRDVNLFNSTPCYLNEVSGTAQVVWEVTAMIILAHCAVRVFKFVAPKPEANPG